MDEKKDYLNKVLHLAMMYGMCKSQQEFAGLLDINKSVLSSALNGNPNYLTDRLVAKVRKFAYEHGIDETPPETIKPEPPKRQIVIPEETLELYTNLSETCRNLSAILARMGMPVSEGAYSKKEGSPEGWMQK